MANIAELVEICYSLTTMTWPNLVPWIRFLKGLAELGVYKRLIKNKKLLSDLIEKKGYRDGENASKNESNVESSSDRQEEGEEIASKNGSEAEEIQESDNDTKNDSGETESGSSEKKTDHLSL